MALVSPQSWMTKLQVVPNSQEESQALGRHSQQPNSSDGSAEKQRPLTENGGGLPVSTSRSLRKPIRRSSGGSRLPGPEEATEARRGAVVLRMGRPVAESGWRTIPSKEVEEVKKKKIEAEIRHARWSQREGLHD